MTKQTKSTAPLSFEERAANAARIKAEYLESERRKVQGRKSEPWRQFLTPGGDIMPRSGGLWWGDV